MTRHTYTLSTPPHSSMVEHHSAQTPITLSGPPWGTSCRDETEPRTLPIRRKVRMVSKPRVWREFCVMDGVA